MEHLRRILDEAFDQAANGKGRERHGNGLGFLDQPVMTITREVGLGFPLGQAIKKTRESLVLLGKSPEMAKNELLGAMVYLAAAALHIEQENSRDDKEV